MLNLIVSFSITLALHEYAHYLVAKIYKRNPELRFEKLVCPYIKYDNSCKYIENCIISMAPLVVHIILFCIGNDFFKIINMALLCMVLPITSDGFTFWSNLVKYMVKQFNDI